MKPNKSNIQISVENKDIQISGKTFALQLHFDNLRSLTMDHEPKVYAEEMEMEIEKVEKFYPKLKDKIRVALHTPQISCVLTANRTEADKIARLHRQWFKEIMLNATPRNFYQEHKKRLKELRNEDGTEETEYPIHFRACGHFLEDDDDADDEIVNPNQEFAKEAITLG